MSIETQLACIAQHREEDRAAQEAEQKDDELESAMRGARDMLFESAKMFRINKDFGHAGMCEKHAANINKFL